jgi:hypothetical protein
MNVQNGYGVIHHLVDETQRLLCGHDDDALNWHRRVISAPVNCPACVRMLADDVRQAGPRTHDSED